MVNKLFSRLFVVGGREAPSPASELMAPRAHAMREALGDPVAVYRDDAADHRVDVHAYGRNFADCDEDDDDGYVLVTSGMSDRPMPIPAGAWGRASPLTELIWYVRKPHREFVGNLRWLAKLANFDNTWFASGHRIPMPEPPLSFCPFKTFLLLTPILRLDRGLLASVETGGPPIETLCVHLISEPEYALIKRDGLRRLFDRLDAAGYPLVFDPHRASLV
ncbi:MAG TPA: suppressor of fused domain protein [Xanthobacteraceae bacterium]|nr:suppressor of fused domain protein [Xanthobacteraceae bacterium]